MSNLQAELETALARFKLVEPITFDDMAAIRDHVRFALGGDTKAEVYRNRPTQPLWVLVLRNQVTARVAIRPFASEAEATRAPGT